MGLILRAVAVSDRGPARENNEDAAYAGATLIAVADGMGGPPAGEVASEIAIKVLSEVGAAPADSTGPPLDTLLTAVDAANRRIREMVEEHRELDGMGTTITAMLLSGGRLALVHVGDSRAYLLRRGTLTQLTTDDTFVQKLVLQGAITADQARRHPQRSLVTRAVQGQPVTPASTVIRPIVGDRFLLCSDGLSDMVDNELIAETLRDVSDLRDCAGELVELALRAGGRDNVTAVLADVVEAG
jgi:PPM family protein phosphatase